MEPIEGSETSAFKPQTPGKYPKENILYIYIYIIIMRNAAAFLKVNVRNKNQVHKDMRSKSLYTLHTAGNNGILTKFQTDRIT